MPDETVIALIVVAIAANILLMAAILLPALLGRRGPIVQEPDDVPPADLIGANHADLAGVEPLVAVLADVPTWAYDRVVRIVAWAFLFSTTVMVGATDLGTPNEPAIFVLLAIFAMFVLVVHELLPPTALGPAKFLVEGSVAITFATLLVALTGRAESPFFFVFPLIVAGAALAVTPRVTLALTAIASLGYILSVIVGADRLLGTGTIGNVGVNLTALILLSYVAMDVAREQRRARQAAIRLSTVDPLTNLFNRTYFFAALEREIHRSARSGRGFCLLMMDLDELKTINDRHGHFLGDQVLGAVGRVIRAGVRRIDTAARYGGDEFVVLLPETDPIGGRTLAEKIRQGVDRLTFPDNPTIRASISTGVVSCPTNGSTADALMISADQAMYVSKRAGKNRVTGPTDPAAGDSAGSDLGPGA